MGTAVGSTSSGRDHGAHVYDIRDFDAVSRIFADAPTALANTQAIQRAYDAAIAGLSPAGYGTVYVPAGDWGISNPIFMDGNKVGFKGEGAGVSSIYTRGHTDIFVLGLARTPLGQSPSADHFPDAFTGGPGGVPVYDSTAVTGLRQRWGLRTKADHHISQMGGPLDRGLGDGYRSVRQLTIAMYIDLSSSPPSNFGSVMGMTDGNTGNPWMLLISGGILYFIFGTVDVNGLNLVEYVYGVYQIPPNAGLTKLDLQVDLINAQISTYVNGVQVTAAGTLGAAFNAAAGLYFVANDHLPFGIGSTCPTIFGVHGSVGAAFDCTFWGLKLTSGLIYTNRNSAGTNDNAGAGTTQTRLDGAPITDYQRYFQYDGLNTIVRLALTDSPTSIATNRLINVLTNFDIPSTAFFADNALTGNPGYSSTAGPIEDLGLVCGNLRYGRCVSICVPNDVRISRCRMQGGCNAIGPLPASTNYPTYIDNCYMTGTDSCISLNFAAAVHISQCSFASALVMLRFNYCNAWVEQCFVLGGNQPDYIIWANQTSLHVSHIGQDSEDADGGPTKAMIYISGNNAGSISPLGSCSHLEYISGGRQKTGSAMVILEDGGSEDGGLNRPNRFSMSHCLVEDSYVSTVVRNNGQRWRGTIEADMTLQRPNWVENTDPSGQGNVIAHHDYYTGPPRDGTWGKNANILRVPQPAASQFTEWRCTASGAYGTANSPNWFGMHPLGDGLSLGAYLQDNTYWAASTPAGGMGFWANGPMCLFLNALFGGAIPAPLTGLFVGLGCRRATRVPSQTVEMVGGNGYARVAVGGGWTLSGAGAVNASAVTFPTATADWVRQAYYDTLNELVFFDRAAGGNYIAAVDIPPTKVLNGQTLSYAAGSIAIARAPSPLGSFADSIHAKMNGLWLNQVPFTTPTIYLALSMAPASLVPPSEPSGGGYARVATSAASWARNLAAYGMSGAISTTGVVTNATALTFPAPTGNWGTGPVQSVYLMDAPSGGNVLGSANLAVPRTILSGSPARSFAVGALWLCRS